MFYSTYRDFYDHLCLKILCGSLVRLTYNDLLQFANFANLSNLKPDVKFYYYFCSQTHN